MPRGCTGVQLGPGCGSGIPHSVRLPNGSLENGVSSTHVPCSPYSLHTTATVTTQSDAEWGLPPPHP